MNKKILLTFFFCACFMGTSHANLSSTVNRLALKVSELESTSAEQAASIVNIHKSITEINKKINKLEEKCGKLSRAAKNNCNADTGNVYNDNKLNTSTTNVRSYGTRTNGDCFNSNVYDNERDYTHNSNDQYGRYHRQTQLAQRANSNGAQWQHRTALQQQLMREIQEKNGIAALQQRQKRSSQQTSANLQEQQLVPVSSKSNSTLPYLLKSQINRRSQSTAFSSKREGER